MRFGVIFGIILAFVLMTLIGSIGQLTYIGSWETTTIGHVMNPFSQNPIAWGASLVDLAFFNYVKLGDGAWQLVRYILLWPLGAAFIVVFFYGLAQIAGSAISGVIRLVGRGI